MIDSVTNKGYRLIESPDRLDPRIISSGLNTSNVGKRIVTMDKVDSTNDEVKRRAAQGEESGLIIAAENQTGGKGRFGRTWSSPGGGIYFTILLRPDLPPNAIPSVTLAAGYGVCLAVREYTGLDDATTVEICNAHQTDKDIYSYTVACNGPWYAYSHSTTVEGVTLTLEDVAVAMKKELCPGLLEGSYTFEDIWKY